MKKSSAEDVANKLLMGNFGSGSTAVARLADPIADTPMVLTLDQLQPYDSNPRLNRNPKYDELKESIRERGLDQAPPVTRRPGEESFIIRNGGNTRLAILKELWTETKDEKFFRINCLFRPWGERGEIVALTGHLAENDMHGALTFIERALGVEQARQMYELESGQAISQRELSRRLKADGYPVSNSHISRMQDAIRYLLPAIPNRLYAGLGVDLVIKLSALRRAVEGVWANYSDRLADQPLDAESFWLETLAIFDDLNESFSITRVQDEFVGQLSSLTGIDYNLLSLEIEDFGKEPKRGEETENHLSDPDSLEPIKSVSYKDEADHSNLSLSKDTEALASEIDNAQKQEGKGGLRSKGAKRPETSSKHESIEAWMVEGSSASIESIRKITASLATELASCAGQESCIQEQEGGVGFVVCRPSDSTQLTAQAELRLKFLEALSSYGDQSTSLGGVGQLLIGLPATATANGAEAVRLSDDELLKLFRLIRNARRIADLEIAGSHEGSGTVSAEQGVLHD